MMPVSDTFREIEKKRYSNLDPRLFDAGAQYNGHYKNIPRSFCLADSSIGANLYAGIRVPAMEYFVRRGIRWHDGLIERLAPSNHLCCSQSCCVNFLFPIAYKPDLIKKIFQSINTLNLDIGEILPIDQDRNSKEETAPSIVFEWIGTKDHLNEQKRKGGSRTRGANYTSADFAFRFRDSNTKKVHLVLGEWKYTEEYGFDDKGIIEARLNNYHDAFYREDGVFAPKYKKLYRALFFEPFYQLLRLQLMAQEMQMKNELDADIVSVLHICPKANKEFRTKVTSQELKMNEDFKGDCPLEIWQKMIPQDRFQSICVEDLLKAIMKNKSEADPQWADYLQLRYGWEPCR